MPNKCLCKSEYLRLFLKSKNVTRVILLTFIVLFRYFLIHIMLATSNFELENNGKLS